MENQIHDAIQKTNRFMKDVHNLEYFVGEIRKREEESPSFQITFIGSAEKKIVIEVLANGSSTVLLTRDVNYSELSVFMNKFMESLS